MKYTGPVYRPPFEANSLLLQVTVGCSHNACSFCTMYREVPFCVEPLEQVERDLQEAARFAPRTRRVFLENGDAFVLSADKLAEIARLIHKYLPHVQVITMYASILNIRTKTDEELRMLRELGINQLNIGVESGLDQALVYQNKLYTAEEARAQLLRLKQAGIDFCLNIIFGAAGEALYRENAEATAKLVNETQPLILFTGTLHADPGCPLYDDLASGAFQENTVRQYLEEQEIVLSALELKDCYYFGIHPSNLIPLAGQLPEDKDALLRELRKNRAQMPERYLDGYPIRGSEGRILS